VKATIAVLLLSIWLGAMCAIMAPSFDNNPYELAVQGFLFGLVFHGLAAWAVLAIIGRRK
jgi:hypothetical protein